MRSEQQTLPNIERRLQVVGLFVFLIGVLFVGRLFHLQIIKGSSYKLKAESAQTKSLAIAPKRGQVFAYNDGQKVPLVLNERRWLVFSDSLYVEDVQKVTEQLQRIGITITDFQRQQIQGKNRYVVLGTLLTDEQKSTVEASHVKGLYFKEQSARSYPEGDLASQVLGFVNADGKGQYGIEQQFDQEMTGKEGRLKAITDSQGVPLAFGEDNIDLPATNGRDIGLTIDVGLQEVANEAIKAGADKWKAVSASAVILDASDGAIKAMANYPSYDPAQYQSVTDISLYGNRSISDAVEPGSVMKPLIMAAALDKGVVGVDDTYYDADQVTLDGTVVHNALDYGAKQRQVEEILNKSLNTGSIHPLSLLGGGAVNQQARGTYHEYLDQKFMLGRLTGIELPGEATGRVYGPDEGYGNNIRYGNMTFGQGLTLTPLQLAAAYAPLVNGGDYYRPYVVDSVGEQDKQPELVAEGALSQQASEGIRELFRRMGQSNYKDAQVPGLEISGKTGTAQIADGSGGYSADEFTGTFAGYVKSSNKTYVIVLRLDRPQGIRFASTAAIPIWKDIVSSIIKTGKVN